MSSDCFNFVLCKEHRELNFSDCNNIRGVRQRSDRACGDGSAMSWTSVKTNVTHTYAPKRDDLFRRRALQINQ